MKITSSISLEKMPAAMQFFSDHWNPDHVLARDRDYFTWRFAAPDGQYLHTILAEEEGQIRCLLNYLPFDFLIAGEAKTGLWVTNLLNADHSGQGSHGLALLLATMNSGVDMVAVADVSPGAQNLYKALRFQLFDDVPRAVKVLDAVGLREFYDRATPPFAINQTQEAADISFHDWRSEGAALWQAYWETAVMPGFTGAVRDSRFITHEYVDHPILDIQVLCGSGDGGLGLLVYRLEKVSNHQKHVVRILDLLGDVAVWPGLFSRMMQEIHRLPIVLIDMVTSGRTQLDFACNTVGFVQVDPASEFLPPRRFQPVEDEHTPIAGGYWLSPALRKSLPEGLLALDPYLSMGDSDLNRPVDQPDI